MLFIIPFGLFWIPFELHRETLLPCQLSRLTHFLKLILFFTLKVGFQIAISLENIKKDSLKVNDLHTATQAPIIAITKIGELLLGWRGAR